MATTSRKQKLPPPPPRTVQTRSRNKESHPGKPDLPQARRPSSLVQAEKAAKAKDQAIREANENNRMQAVADIEDSQDKEDAEADYHANHPPPANLPPRTQRSVAKLSSTNISSTIEECLPVESEDTGDDEYEPEGSDEEVDELAEEDIEEVGEHQILAKKTSRRKKMRRSDVMAVRTFSTSQVTHGKRKEPERGFSTSQGDQTTSKKVKPLGMGGLLRNWEPSVLIPSVPSRGPSRASSKASNPPDSSDAGELSDAVGVHQSIFADEDDNVERQNLTMGSNVELTWDEPVPYVRNTHVEKQLPIRDLESTNESAADQELEITATGVRKPNVSVTNAFEIPGRQLRRHVYSLESQRRF
ncbi:hypothetical protein PHLCEN_2v12035 [Hermanssonia centrifuga]|uniref:Uncharacterized protein n=1 Tax=Hermanssonia centrifuga TaxID=98765 RepID=A0A2R6NID9_9APHY|nr:hypothetical protein PHLCEN_2v12035 [Hermanssonia centrifuga]